MRPVLVYHQQSATRGGHYIFVGKLYAHLPYFSRTPNFSEHSIHPLHSSIRRKRTKRIGIFPSFTFRIAEIGRHTFIKRLPVWIHSCLPRRCLERIVAVVKAGIRNPWLLTRQQRIKRNRIHGEIYARDRRVFSERGLDSRYQYRPYLLLILELYFILCGMDVHIDARRIDRELQEIAWLRVRCDKRIVTAQHRLVKIGVPHVASVHDKELQGISASCEFRSRHEAFYPDKRSIDLNREQLLALEIVFPYILDAETEQGSPKVDQTRAVVNGQTYLIVDQGESFELPHYVGEFHIVAFQEFSARRHIEKELAHTDACSLIAHTGLLRLDL